MKRIKATSAKKTGTRLEYLSASICALILFGATGAKAVDIYFDDNGTSAPISGSWTTSSTLKDWASSSTQVASPPDAWNSADTAVFNAGSSVQTFSVAVGSGVVAPGVFNGGVGSTVGGNITFTGSPITLSGGAGVYALTSRSSTFSGGLAGSGTAIAYFEGGGTINLPVADTYGGGTIFGASGNTLVYYGNSGSFGTGAINLYRTGNFSTIGNSSGGALTVANAFASNFANSGATTGLNFVNSVNSPSTYSGAITLGTGASTVSLNVRNGSPSSAPVTLSGVISGAGSLNFDSNLGSDTTQGTTILKGANTFTGTVTVFGAGRLYGSGNPATTGVGTLQLGAANTISSATGLTMAGGVLNLNDFSQTINGTLNVTANSTILMGDPSSLSFTGVAGSWGGILNLADWADGDSLFVGIGATINSSQVEFDGISPSQDMAYVNPAGYVVPEPSSVALSLIGGLGFLGMAWKSRRKA